MYQLENELKKSVRIVSNGMAQGGSTKIFDANTDVELHQVASVAWEHKAGDIARATVVFLMPEIEVVGEVIEVIEK